VTSSKHLAIGKYKYRKFAVHLTLNS